MIKNHVAAGKGTEEVALTGTTTNSYVAALTLDARSLARTTITVKNTDGANALKYKVEVRYSDYANGDDYEVVPETEITAGDWAVDEWIYKRAMIKISVKSSVADSHATYQIYRLSDRW